MLRWLNKNKSGWDESYPPDKMTVLESMTLYGEEKKFFTTLTEITLLNRCETSALKKSSVAKAKGAPYPFSVIPHDYQRCNNYGFRMDGRSVAMQTRTLPLGE